MVARIIHFGPDECRRLLVLRSSGFTIDECPSLSQLRSALENKIQPVAVIISETRLCGPADAIALIRAHTRAPLILFQNMAPSYSESDFNLVIPVLTHPTEWLHRLRAVIELSCSTPPDQIPRVPPQPERSSSILRHKA
ncbi:MAG TPA: hypothetical protein VFW25_11075 [Silvibacterium sp.]|nr:hypothetical protein [Silvibacterium sp.]